MATIKKAQKGCKIARETAKEDRKAERQWARMAKSDKASERMDRKAERQSRREESRSSRSSGSKLRSGSFMFQDGGKAKKVKLKEDSRDYITKIKTDEKGNVTSLKSRRTLKGLVTGAPRAKKIMKKGGTVPKGYHKMPSGKIMKNSAHKAKKK